jgi:hypothetical protein
MSILNRLFKPKPYPLEFKTEVNALIDELIEIGKKEDFLSVVPGGSFNAQCRHVRTRRIAERLNIIGRLDLMQFAFEQVRKKAGKVLASHLEYAWSDIGPWQV